MKKRLVIVIWNMGIGGIQKRMRDVALDIAQHKKDWEITFLIRRKMDSHFADALAGKNHIRLMYYPFQGIHFPLGFIAWIAIQYAVLKPTVLLTFLAQLTIVLVVIKKLVFWRRTTLVVNEGAFMTGYLRYNKMGYLRIPLSWAYARVDRIIVPTRACKSDLVAAFGVLPSRIYVVPNWTLMSAGRHDAPWYDGVFIGRFEWEKNPLVMVELADRLRVRFPRLRIGIAGDGKMKKLLVEHIQAKNLSSVVDLLPPDEAKDALSHARILIVPSYNEGMPNVVLEAAMHGVPSVTHNFPGAAEVVQNGKTGYITNNVEEMSQVVSQLLRKPSLCHQVGASAQSFVQKNFHASRQKEFIEALLFPQSP